RIGAHVLLDGLAAVLLQVVHEAGQNFLVRTGRRRRGAHGGSDERTTETQRTQRRQRQRREKKKKEPEITVPFSSYFPFSLSLFSVSSVSLWFHSLFGIQPLP